MSQVKIDYDFIIVGQGLAGTMAAHFLSKYTDNFLVLDAEKHTASFAAAGIINPVTGRNYVKSWLIDTILPFAKKTYDEINQILGISCYQEINIIRSLYSVKEENDWMARVNDVSYQSYLLHGPDTSFLKNLVKNNCAYGEITKSLQINLIELILSYREFLKSKGKYQNKEVDCNNIINHNSYFEIGDLNCKKIIFCQGYKAIKNEYTKHLSFSPAKGNALIIKGDFHFQKILRDHIFITPLKDGTHWVGSGYQFNIDNELPDDLEQMKLEETLKNILSVDYEVIERKAGIRPATKSRRPMLGEIPTVKNMYLLNGLGTKGSSLSPYFASMLIEYIINSKKIINDVAIK